MIEPQELLATLRGGHFRYITKSEMRCLAYFALGYPAEEIAEAVAESPATVRRHIRRVQDAVGARVSLEIPRDVFRTWIWCHASDCRQRSLK